MSKITELQKGLSSKSTPDDFIDSYEETLDDRHGHFMGYPASRILKEVDPIAYRCGLRDHVNELDVEDSEEYKDYLSQLEELEAELGCENMTSSDSDNCSQLFNCCDCGIKDGGQCCPYCFSCNACDYCLSEQGN